MQNPNLPERQQYERLLAFREQFLLYHLAMDTKCIIGHIVFSEIAHERYSDRYTFATSLREPIQRLISNYRFTKKSYSPELDETALIDYLDSFEGQNQGVTYTRYFCGLPHASDVRNDDAVQKAIANLSKFDVVGVVEDMSGFATALGTKLKLPLNFGKHNTGADSNATIFETLSPALQQRIRETCAQDMLIYRAAQKQAGDQSVSEFSEAGQGNPR